MSDKKCEGATFPGMCYICGGVIYVGDTIVRAVINDNYPVAAHLECDAKLQDLEGQ